jgi:predicted NUDIX family NTP pyrophosphohydrolase
MKRSAGLMLYRRRQALIEVLLAHPGGPFWMKKDDGVWSIPKGLYEEGEDALAAARREFAEETGLALAESGETLLLGNFKQPGGKLVTAYAVEGEFDPKGLKSNLFSIEWPPRSGRMQEFPEIDRAGWFEPQEARRKLLRGQVPILEALLALLQV